MGIIGKIIFALMGIAGALLTLCYFHSNWYNLISFIFHPKFKKAEKQHKYGYIICARNEENVIADLIKSIWAQDYPKDLMRVYVMADNCTDGTAECAHAAGATKVFTRTNKEHVGKGYAMQALFEELLKDDEAMQC